MADQETALCAIMRLYAYHASSAKASWTGAESTERHADAAAELADTIIEQF